MVFQGEGKFSPLKAISVKWGISNGKMAENSETPKAVGAYIFVNIDRYHSFF